MERWLSEQQCARPGVFGISLITFVRPDGHGVWSEDGQKIAFFLEYDTGTERQSVLVDKLVRYGAHVQQGGPRWPVLCSLPTAAREQHLHHLLDQDGSPVPVATAARDIDPTSKPTDAIWLVHGKDRRPRRLIELAELTIDPP